MLALGSSKKSHKARIVSLACTIRCVHSVCNTDSKGEATCLREIAFSPFGRRTPFREICVRQNIIRVG